MRKAGAQASSSSSSKADVAAGAQGVDLEQQVGTKWLNAMSTSPGTSLGAIPRV
jgi:hypothetical protein